MTRLLIADEYPVMREGLRVHLESQPGWSVVAEAKNGKEAVLKGAESKPDVAVLAHELSVLDGIEATRQLRVSAPSTEVLIYTIESKEEVLRGLLDAGARGVVLKSEPVSRLIEGVQTVASHKPYFAPARMEETLLKLPNAMATPLTNRERTVVRLIAEGQTTKQIARTLGISHRTAETHRAQAMRKLGIGSSATLVRYAARNGLIES
jgi:DNA-binding NarL/FixJ family response regulator